MRRKDINSISKTSNRLLNSLFFSICFIMLLPLLFAVVISFSSHESIVEKGYSFFPSQVSLEGYAYIFHNAANVLNSFLVSVLVTVVGTLLGTYLIATYAYVISRDNFKYRKVLTILALIPLLFPSGMVANYLVMTTLLGLKDNLWALILPLAVNSFYLFILKTFFQSFVPKSIIESARVDGASEFTTFFKIIILIAKPGIATIALFLTLAYWNDWFHAMLYIESPNKIPVQYLLIRIENTALFLKQMGSQMGVGLSEAASGVPSDSIRMAIVVLIVLPIALSYPYFQKYFVRGLTVGAIKE